LNQGMLLPFAVPWPVRLHNHSDSRSHYLSLNRKKNKGLQIKKTGPVFSA
jgi:hypothetical protein